MPPREMFKSNNTKSQTSTQSCRRRLQNTYEESDPKEESRISDRSVLSVLSLNDNTRRALRNGAERISRTFNNVRTTFGTLSQKFRVSTKRRQILEEGPMTPNGATPHAKQVLGRTPTKLYSPFGIETPYKSTTIDKENYVPK